ncbi:hypothetical protein AS850_02780 [Frondihabitans sp. 762G35]|nr:hypothetical protein AS850_02780 [Frondihabitans sp. 762G35]
MTHAPAEGTLAATADCITCENDQRARGEIELWDRTFIVCPACGNKRCPRASWHANPCSHSNAPGQPGSYYGTAPIKLEALASADKPGGTI